jgi:hypothetical protein
MEKREAGQRDMYIRRLDLIPKELLKFFICQKR